MEDKHSIRRLSGSGEKQKGKSSKKKKKNKPKERKRTAEKIKTSSPDETNSDSTLDWARKHAKAQSQSNLLSSSDRTKYAITSGGKNSLQHFSGSKAVSSAPTLSTRNNNATISVDKKGLQDLYAMFPDNKSADSNNNRQQQTASRGSDDSSSADSSSLSNGVVGEITKMVDESLRWDEPRTNPEEEAERIRVYKMNRRKRYLVDAYQRREDKESVLKLARELSGEAEPYKSSVSQVPLMRSSSK